ncbi:MAG TPA: hypothetical protein PKG79_06145, partial [Propioniciclava tarda]|nr:hypothetical protein [Propioniciclava tarda]
EQRRIVEIIEDHFSRLDATEASLRGALSRGGALLRSALAHAFDGKVNAVPLGDLIDRVEAGKSLGGSARPRSDGEWGIIKVSAMTWGEFRPEENKMIPDHLADARYSISAGDLLLSRANTSEYVGASVYVRQCPEHLLLSDKSLRLRPRRGVHPEWLWRVLSSPRSRSQISDAATGTKQSMRNISQGSLLRVLVPDPGGHLQDLEIENLNRIDEGCARLTNEVSHLGDQSSSLRRAILAAAFSGRLTGSASDADRIEELASAAPPRAD